MAEDVSASVLDNMVTSRMYTKPCCHLAVQRSASITHWNITGAYSDRMPLGTPIQYMLRFEGRHFGARLVNFYLTVIAIRVECRQDWRVSEGAYTLIQMPYWIYVLDTHGVELPIFNREAECSFLL